MKKIYLLLSRTRSVLSRTIYIMTGEPYTHVAIAFDRSLQELYSSSRWNGKDLFPSGPCQEYLQRGFYALSNTPCLLCELSVDDHIHEQARAEVQRIVTQKEQYHYSVLGLPFCFLGIPMQREGYFFCSQFVGEILERSGALTLPRDSSLLKPSDYCRLPQLKPCFQGTTIQLLHRCYLWQVEEHTMSKN